METASMEEHAPGESAHLTPKEVNTTSLSISRDETASDVCYEVSSTDIPSSQIETDNEHSTPLHVVPSSLEEAPEHVGISSYQVSQTQDQQATFMQNSTVVESLTGLIPADPAKEESETGVLAQVTPVNISSNNFQGPRVFEVSGKPVHSSETPSKSDRHMPTIDMGSALTSLVQIPEVKELPVSTFQPFVINESTFRDGDADAPPSERKQVQVEIEQINEAAAPITQVSTNESRSITKATQPQPSRRSMILVNNRKEKRVASPISLFSSEEVQRAPNERVPQASATIEFDDGTTRVKIDKRAKELSATVVDTSNRFITIQQDVKDLKVFAGLTYIYDPTGCSISLPNENAKIVAIDNRPTRAQIAWLCHVRSMSDRGLRTPKRLRLADDASGRSFSCLENLDISTIAEDLQVDWTQRKSTSEAKSRHPGVLSVRFAGEQSSSGSKTGRVDKGTIEPTQAIGEGGLDLWETSTLPCTCRRSNCLKRYCPCFNAKKFCSKACICTNCFNKVSDRATYAWRKANVLQSHDKPIMCLCRNSRCLKRYCDCRANDQLCNPKCQCINCGNIGPESEVAVESNTGHASPIVAAQPDVADIVEVIGSTAGLDAAGKYLQ